MKVKIGSIIHDSNDEPIMVILSEEEKKLVRNIGDQVRFCSFPHKLDASAVMKFMREDPIIHRVKVELTLNDILKCDSNPNHVCTELTKAGFNMRENIDVSRNIETGAYVYTQEVLK